MLTHHFFPCRWEFVTKDHDIGFGVFSKPLDQDRKLHAGEMAVHVSVTVCVRVYSIVKMTCCHGCRCHQVERAAMLCRSLAIMFVKRRAYVSQHVV